MDHPDNSNTTNSFVLPHRPSISLSPTAVNTASSNMFADVALSPSSVSRALKRPRAPGSRPKSMISLSTHPYQRLRQRTPRNVDDMDVDTIHSPGFVEQLIHEIENEPVEPPATDQPRQNKRWSTTPPVRHIFQPEQELTPDEERTAIAKLRNARHMLPKDQWWKLVPSHRKAIAALERQERSNSIDIGLNITPTPESSISSSTHEENEEAAKGPETTSGLRTEVVEALAFTHVPNPREVRPVGQNGVDLEYGNHIKPSLRPPPDYSPDAWQRWQNLKNVIDLQNHAYMGARLSAYLFENGDIFNISDPFVQQRLRRVEECWQQGRAAMNVETHFWNAVYERQHEPNQFSVRDTYLCQANAIEFAAKIFVFRRSERDVYNQVFNRYRATAFDCPEEDQEGFKVDIPELADMLLKFIVQSRSEVQQVLHATTKSVRLLRIE